jgi:diguanylate cyclase
MEQVWSAASGGLLAATVVAWLALALTWLRRRRSDRAAAHAPATAAASAVAVTDPVSGLPLRAVFDAAVDDAAHTCDRQGTSMSLIYIGLDSFRLVNDAYGHGAGDRLLALVPERLRQAAPDLIVATRVAGDEFLLAVPGDVDAAQRTALQLRQALRHRFRVDAVDLAVDVSMGIASYPLHGSRQRLQIQAAAAMRAVKQAGGGAHAVFEPAMGVDLRQQAEMLRDLRDAVSNGALQLVYQPKIDALSLQVTAAEALLRWHDPTRGVVSPTVFVPLAEKYGLIVDIGRWVIEEACRQAGVWRALGLRMRVAVNISGVQLRHDDWVAHLCDSLKRHGLAPSRFTCEITETVAMEDTRVTRAAFEHLRQAGVHVSIDDFGTGHSSLATLRKLPAAELKIDRAFVTDLAHSEDARSIAATIVRMAHDLDMRVVAEGVETEAQRDCLVKMGCDELQGFLFAKPMSAAALTIWANDDQGPSALGFRDSLFRETAAQDLPND